MKKIFLICLISLCATALQTNAQMRDTSLKMNMHKVDAASLLQKSKKQKTTAWILLGGGAGLATAGYIIGRNASKKDAFGFWSGSSSEATTGGVLVVAGSGGIVGSIPFFIASGKNKRKANLILKDEAVFFNQELTKKEHIVSLALKIYL